MSTNYAAHLDMVGFGNAVLLDFDEAWGALSDLWFAMEKILQSIVIPIPAEAPRGGTTLMATGFRLADRLSFEFFSDSIIIYTHGDSDEDLFMILSAVTMLFGEALRRCVPLRGGIGYGRFRFDPNRRGVLMGESVVNACRAGEHAQWIGVVLQEQAARRSEGVIESCKFIPWAIGRKAEESALHMVLNWPTVFRDWFPKGPPLSLREWYQPFEKLLGPYRELTPHDQGKWANTVDFINTQLSAGLVRDLQVRK